jgi:hypothetical protein
LELGIARSTTTNPSGHETKDYQTDSRNERVEMPKFKYGDTVVLRSDSSLTGMKAGDAGVVIVWYDMEPPAYEVHFCNSAGKAFDAMMMEDELDFPPPGVRLPLPPGFE